MISKIHISRNVHNRRLRFTITTQGALPSEFIEWVNYDLGQPGVIGKKVFEVSLGKFVRSLPSFATMRARSGRFPVEMDDAVAEIVRKQSEQKKKVAQTGAEHNKKLGTAEILKVLEKQGFGRANSLSKDQQRDLEKLLGMENGANFSVPGAGKTTVLLALNCFLTSKNTNLQLLVIAPRNAQISWDEEVEACLGVDKKVVRLEGGRTKIKSKLADDPAISIITYQQLLNTDDLLVEFMLDREIHLVLDESHRIKAGSLSRQGDIALSLGPMAFRRDILSGTPMPQGLSDMRSQMEFLWPGTNPVPNPPAAASDEELLMRSREELVPFFVRTTKQELNLPDPRLSIKRLGMSPIQQAVYLEMRESLMNQLQTAEQTGTPLAELAKQVVRMIMFCSDPGVFLKRLKKSDPLTASQFPDDLMLEESAKLKELDALVEDIVGKSGGKIVIWSSFIDVIEMLENRYAKLGATSIHGGIATSDDPSDFESREARIKRFKNKKSCRVLVANPAACGEGISLHQTAHDAVYMDRNFNAAHYLQSVDRIHRRGLPPETDTNIYVLCYTNSVDEAVEARLKTKIAAMEVVLNDSSISKLIYEPEDIENFADEFQELDFQDLREIVGGFEK